MTTLIRDNVWRGEGAPPSTRPRAGPSAWAGAIAGAWAKQRDRWILWWPVAAIAGAAAWLLAPRDPPFWLIVATLLGGGGSAAIIGWWPTAALGRTRALLAALLAAATAAGLGAVAAQVRVWAVDAPRLTAPLEGVALEGWVAGIEGGPRPRMKVLVRAIEGVERTPRFVRVSVAPGMALSPGRALRCRVSLQPPAAPLAPGAYDFARRAYFMKLGGVGYAWGRCRPALLAPPPGRLDRVILWVGAVRGDLAGAIREGAAGRGGAIAAALIAGDESAIDETTHDALFDSGLGHLISVSGLHMSVVGGLVFGALLLIFSLIPPIALRVTVRKIAAIGALTALGAYLVVSGSSVPAIRSFIMAAVAFGAILIDRPAITMRGLATAALIIVLIYPESVLEPGFQMSFAATMALVATFEATRRTPEEAALPSPGPLIGGLQGLGRGMSLILMSSLVAGLATDPFVLFHFQRFTIYGLAANLAAAPIVTFVVAPSAALAAIAAPFGLADGPLTVLSGALDYVAAIGAAFGDRPEAVRVFPRPPDIFLPLAAMALLWACLWRGVVRWGGIAWLAAAAAVYLTAPQPIIAFDPDLRAVFMRENGAWRMAAAIDGRSTFARERLGQQLGISPLTLEAIPPPDNCVASECAWRTPTGRPVILVRTPTDVAHACVQGAIVISAVPLPRDLTSRCALALTITPASRAREGGGLIYETANSILVERAAPANILRPWTAASAAQ